MSPDPQHQPHQPHQHHQRHEDEDPLRAHYAALRSALATDPSDARSTRLLLLARLEARTEQRRERRRTLFSAAVALGCALFMGLPAAWALARAFSPAPIEPTVLPALDAAPPAAPASPDVRAVTAGGAPRSPRTVRPALRRRGALAPAVAALAAMREPQPSGAPELLEAPELSPPSPDPEPAAPAELTPSPPPEPARVVDEAPPASYLRAIDLVRRMHDADAEPLLRGVLAETRSAHWRREAARVLELLLARRGPEVGARTSH